MTKPAVHCPTSTGEVLIRVMRSELAHETKQQIIHRLVVAHETAGCDIGELAAELVANAKSTANG